MNIGIFAYNFSHMQSYTYLMRLLVEGYEIKCIFAQNWKQLGFTKPVIRNRPRGLHYPIASKVADRFNIPYHILEHNSQECIALIKENNLDLGILFGAQILKKSVIDVFKIGIMNIHWSLLPFNRGYDSLKWNIMTNIPQGVTAHLIDERVDWGSIIHRRVVNVYEDDTLLDVYLRIENQCEIIMLDALKTLSQGYTPRIHFDEGTLNRQMPPNIEAQLPKKFEWYKKHYWRVWQNDSKDPIC